MVLKACESTGSSKSEGSGPGGTSLHNGGPHTTQNHVTNGIKHQHSSATNEVTGEPPNKKVSVIKVDAA